MSDDAPVQRYDPESSEDELRPEDSISRRGDPVEEDPGGGADPAEESQLNETANQTQTQAEGEVKKKRIIRNPQPKLNPERITGNRGVGALEDIFKNFKPKGKITTAPNMVHV